MTRKRVRRRAKGPSAVKLPGKPAGEINGFQIRRVRVSDLRPADYNPRAITERAFSGLKASVGRFGMVEPIVVNKRTGNMVGGHQRLKTLDGGDTDVVIVDLSVEEEKALNLALNNRHSSGSWTEGLGDLLDGLQGVVGEMFEELNLDDLRVEVPRLPHMVNPPTEFPEVSEDIETTHHCPKCGYQW